MTFVLTKIEIHKSNQDGSMWIKSCEADKSYLQSLTQADYDTICAIAGIRYPVVEEVMR